MVRRIRRSYMNCYVLRGETGSILVDSCYCKDAEKLYEALKDENIKLIFLTHCHFDHVGSAMYLSKRLGAPIAMSPQDERLIGHGEDSHLKARTFLGSLIAGNSLPVLKAATYSKFEPEVALEDGTDLSPYGVAAHAVALPGHTAGSMGILTDDGRTMIVGDAMFNIIRPTGSRIYEDYEGMCRSVQRIRELDPDIIYVGHGKPITRRKFPDKI